MASIGDRGYATALANLNANLGISPSSTCTARLVTAVGANKSTAGTAVSTGTNPAYADQTVTWATPAADGNGDPSTSNTAVLDWGALAGGPTIVGVELYVGGVRVYFKSVASQAIAAGNHYAMAIGALVIEEG